MAIHRSLVVAGLAVIVCLVCVADGQTPTPNSSSSSVTPSKSTPTITTTHSFSPSTSESPNAECFKHNGTCDECIGVPGAKCLYCYADNSCKPYPVGHVLPSSSDCPQLSKARWGVCWLNFEALIIAMGVIGGAIVLTIASCCIYCCCCRGGNKTRYAKEDAKFEAQKAERKQKSDERRADRKQRMDEIRRKYGLMKEETPYQRFEA